MANAIAVLVEDHRRMRALFEEFEALRPTAYVHQSKLIARIIELVTVHTFLLRDVLHPRIRALVPGLVSALDDFRADLRAAERAAAELWTMRPGDEQFGARAAALIEKIRVFLDTQEDHWYPRLAEALAPTDLDALATELLRARRRAPVSPRISGG